MNNFLEVLKELLNASAYQISALFTNFAPKIIFAAALILAGWFLAALTRKLASKILKALGFNVFAEKTGIQGFLQKGGIDKSPSFITGTIFYWVILLNTFIAASDIFEAGMTTSFLEDFFIFIPKLAAVVIIIAMGIIAGKFIGKVITKAGKMAGMPLSNYAGQLGEYIIIALSLLAALNYLNVPRMILIQISIIIIALIPLCVLLLLIGGGTDIISNILAYRYIKKEFSPGDSITFSEAEGEIVSIGRISLKLKKHKNFIIIPNSKIAANIIQKKQN